MSATTIRKFSKFDDNKLDWSRVGKTALLWAGCHDIDVSGTSGLRCTTMTKEGETSVHRWYGPLIVGATVPVHRLVTAHGWTARVDMAAARRHCNTETPARHRFGMCPGKPTDQTRTHQAAKAGWSTLGLVRAVTQRCMSTSWWPGASNEIAAGWLQCVFCVAAAHRRVCRGMEEEPSSRSSHIHGSFVYCVSFGHRCLGSNPSSKSQSLLRSRDVISLPRMSWLKNCGQRTQWWLALRCINFASTYSSVS